MSRNVFTAAQDHLSSIKFQVTDRNYELRSQQSNFSLTIWNTAAQIMDAFIQFWAHAQQYVAHTLTQTPSPAHYLG